MIAAAAATALMASTAIAQNTNDKKFTVTLEGEQVTVGGDPDGTGTATIRINVDAGQVCYRLRTRKIDQATASHIHEGAIGTDGPVVVNFTPPGANGMSSGCVNVGRELASEIASEPSDYYVVVHTVAFPAGALRGQMSS
jgi:hypothetical protein